jgi:hypothetical protein
MTDSPPAPRATKSKKMVAAAAYEEALNLVRNTLHVDEREALSLAGYSEGVYNHWRKDGRFPLVAINALHGLLVGHEIQRGDVDKQPLRLSIDDLERLLLALAKLDLQSREVQSYLTLRAALHREIARRLEAK